MESTTQTASMPTVAAPVLAAVAVKLTPFWTSNAEAWFQQAEAQFALSNVILEEMRYWHVISALNSTTAIRVSPLLPTLPSRYSYMELKNLLISTYGLSDDQCARQFLSMTELGDRQPSELMDEMLCLHGTEELNFTIRFPFKRVLPQPVRHTLSAFLSIDLRQWAHEADR